MRRDAAVGFAERDPAAFSRGQRFRQPAVQRRGLEHREMARLAGEPAAAQLQRRQPQLRGEFVDEALDEEHAVGMRDAAPEPDRNDQLPPHEAHLRVGPVVHRVADPGNDGLVFGRSGGAGRRHAFAVAGEHGLRDHHGLDRGQRAVRREPRTHAGGRRRPVHVVLQVLLARPEHLHRHPGQAGRQGGRGDHVVEFGAPPETAAQQGRVELDAFGLEAGDARRLAARQRRRLRRRPEREGAVGAQVRGRVHGFHADMREEGHGVLALEARGRPGRVLARRVVRVLHHLQDIG